MQGALFAAVTDAPTASRLLPPPRWARAVVAGISVAEPQSATRRHQTLVAHRRLPHPFGARPTLLDQAIDPAHFRMDRSHERWQRGAER